jgi:hypothetical protein
MVGYVIIIYLECSVVGVGISFQEFLLTRLHFAGFYL